MSDTESEGNKMHEKGLASKIIKAKKKKKQVFMENSVPTLVELAIDVVADNITLYPDLNGVYVEHIKENIIQQCSRDIPVKVAARNIDYEFYWEDCCDAKIPNCKRENHGNSYKQMFIEKYLEDLLENYKQDPNAKETSDMEKDENLKNLIQEISACRYDCFSLNITQLLSHLDMSIVFDNLPNLSYLSLTYGAKHVGMEYDRQRFGMKMQDARIFSECLRKSHSLVKLALPCNLIDDELINILFKGLMINKTISQLDLSHNRIGNTGAMKIAKFLAHTQILTHLDLGDNSISYQGSRFLSQGIANNNSLRVLSLYLNEIDDKGGMKFCQELKGNNKTLLELNLRGNSLQGEFARALAELILDTNLTKIDISCNLIKNKKDAIAILDSLKDNPNIIEFDIRNNKIKDVDVEEEISDVVFQNFINQDKSVKINIHSKEDGKA